MRVCSCLGRWTEWGDPMGDARFGRSLIAFALLMVGTAGLLLNEFVFAWGTAATGAFAVSNAVGLLILSLGLLKSAKARSGRS